MKIAINVCFGGFGLSDKAYERLIELGIPVKKYDNSDRNYQGIYDRELTPKGEDSLNDLYWENKNILSSVSQRYWDVFSHKNRTNSLIIQTIEELGEKANGMYAELKIIEIPDNVDWEIDDYDGCETVHEEHRCWN